MLRRSAVGIVSRSVNASFAHLVPRRASPPPSNVTPLVTLPFQPMSDKTEVGAEPPKEVEDTIFGKIIRKVRFSAASLS
jgi:hypothetical protein